MKTTEKLMVGSCVAIGIFSIMVYREIQKSQEANQMMLQEIQQLKAIEIANNNYLEVIDSKVTRGNEMLAKLLAANQKTAHTTISTTNKK